MSAILLALIYDDLGHCVIVTPEILLLSSDSFIVFGPTSGRCFENI